MPGRKRRIMARRMNIVAWQNRAAAL